VDFSVSVTCAVTARMNVPGSALLVEKTFEAPEEFSDTFIAKMLAEAESTRSSDETELKRIEAVGNAKALISEAEGKLKVVPDARLSEAIAALGLALASGDDSKIREGSDALAAAITAPTFGSFDFGNFFGTPKRPTTAKATPAIRPAHSNSGTSAEAR
jgi:hypothetical protein